MGNCDSRYGQLALAQFHDSVVTPFATFGENWGNGVQFGDAQETLSSFASRHKRRQLSIEPRSPSRTRDRQRKVSRLSRGPMAGPSWKTERVFWPSTRRGYPASAADLIALAAQRKLFMAL